MMDAKDKECTNYFPQTERNKRTPSLFFLQICQYVWQLLWEKIVFTILIFALFLWNKKRKLFTYGEHKLAANNLFKKKKTNFFKRAIASNTLKEYCSKRETYCLLSNLNNVKFFLPYQFWTLFSWQHVRILLYWTTFVWCIFWYKRTSFIQTIFFLQRFS